MRFLGGNFSNCGQNISAGLWKLHATCAEKVLTRNNFLKGCSFWKLILEFVEKLFALAVSLASGTLSKLLFCVHGNAQNFRCRFYLAILSKLLFLCPCQCSKYTYTFWQKNYRTILFCECGQKMFGPLKIFQQVGKTSFHLSKETLEAVMTLTEIFIRIIFEVWAEKNLMFVKIFFVKSVDFFRKDFFVFENSKQYCRNLNNNLRTFQTKSSPVFQIPYNISNRFLEGKRMSEIV